MSKSYSRSTSGPKQLRSRAPHSIDGAFAEDEDELIMNRYPLTGQWVWDTKTLAGWFGRRDHAVQARRLELSKREEIHHGRRH